MRRPEQAWISAYRQLVERMGHQAVDAGLKFARADWHFAKGQVMRDTIHNAIATQTLSDYVSGEAAALPDRPSLFPSNAVTRWKDWTRIASLLHEGRAEMLVEEADVLAGVQLAFAAGQLQTAIELTERGLPKPKALHVLKQLMKRLDQGCGAYLWQDGTGHSAAIPLYRFPVKH